MKEGCEYGKYSDGFYRQSRPWVKMPFVGLFLDFSMLTFAQGF